MRKASNIFGSVQKSSEHLRTFLVAFGSLWKTIRKSSEVARTFSEIPVIRRRKSHAFDSEKVGRSTMDI